MVRTADAATNLSHVRKMMLLPPVLMLLVLLVHRCTRRQNAVTSYSIRRHRPGSSTREVDGRTGWASTKWFKRRMKYHGPFYPLLLLLRTLYTGHGAIGWFPLPSSCRRQALQPHVLVVPSPPMEQPCSHVPPSWYSRTCEHAGSKSILRRCHCQCKVSVLRTSYRIHMALNTAHCT